MSTMTHDRNPRTAQGLVFAVASAASFGLSGSLARGLLDAGWTSAAAVAARVLLAGVVLLPLAVVRLRGRWDLLRRNVGVLAVFGLVAVAGCQFTYFNAVEHLPVAVALLIEYVAPVAVVLWMWLRHGQRPGRLTVAGGALAAVGPVLVLDVLGAGPVSLIGIAWALGAMVSVAFYFVIASHEDNGLPGVVLATAGLLIGGLGLLLAGVVGLVPLRASTQRIAFDSFTAPWWAVVLALGIVTAAIAYVTGIAASRRLGSRLASFVALGEVLAALVFAAVLLGEVPGAVQLVGALVVLAGVVVVKLGEPRTVADEPLPSVLPSDEDLVRQ